MSSTICYRVLQIAGTAAVLIGGVATYLSVSAARDGGHQDPAAAEAVDISAATVILDLDDGEGAINRLAAMRKSLRGEPVDVETAARYATLALHQYAISGDARLPGYAEGALSPWRAEAAPPAPIWLLRARLEQTQHRFAEAAADLERFLAPHPDSVEATLLAADAWRRAGEFGRSRSYCARLAIIGRGDLARYCAADVLLSLGEPDRASAAVAAIDRDLRSMQPATARWALSVASEVKAASREYAEARDLYERAIRYGDADLALYVAYADLLIEMQQPADALAALSGRADTDAVLIRRAMAAAALEDPRLDDWRRQLDESFATAETLGVDKLHLRERALFEWRVAGNPGSALAFATENWARQKGREDALLLQQTAQAAGRPEAAQVVDAWRSRFIRAGREAG